MSKNNDKAKEGNKGKMDEGAFSTVSDTDRALAHFRQILADPEATQSAKSNAASELAKIDQRQGRPDVQEVSKMSRGYLVAEIERVRAVVSGVMMQQGEET